MYKKCYSTRLKNNKFKIHLWDEGGYDEIEWTNYAYKECREDKATHRGINGEYLLKTHQWYKTDSNLTLS